MQPSVVESRANHNVRSAGEARAADESVAPPWPLSLALTLVCPLLIWAAFPKLNVAVLAFVALAPMFWLWSKSSWRAAFWWGWAFGGFATALLGSWAITSLGDFIGGWAFLGIVVLGVVEGFSMAVVAALVAAMCRGRFGISTMFAVPAGFLLTEFARTQGQLGIPFGELGLVGVHLSWLLPTAAFFGVYGMSAIVALCNGALVALFAGVDRSTRIAGAALLVVLAACVVAANLARANVQLPPATVPVAVAQGAITQRQKWTPQIFAYTLDTYESLTRDAARAGARVVFWPETAVTAHPLNQPDVLARLQRIARDNRITLMAGTLELVSYPPEVDYNAVLAIDPDGRVQGTYRKKILVPFAEYLPADRFLRGLPLVSQASRFVSGPGATPLQGAGMRFGILICYESAFAQYARETALVSDALAVLTDDAWFGSSSGPYQHADMAIVDAVETGRWVVRGGDTGISQIVDPLGRVIAYLPLDEKGFIIGLIGPPNDTPYDRIGDGWFVWPVLAMLALGFVRQRVRGDGWRSRRGAP